MVWVSLRNGGEWSLQRGWFAKLKCGGGKLWEAEKVVKNTKKLIEIAKKRAESEKANKRRHKKRAFSRTDNTLIMMEPSS